MKLYGTTTSPYVRRVRVAAAEIGVDVELHAIKALAIVFIVAAACSGGAPSPRIPEVSGPLAGTRWITAAQPWRTNASVTALLATGPTALFGGRHGWLAELDLSTGLTVREKTIGKLAISELLQLADGRILALGITDRKPAAVVLDPKTLAPTPIDLAGVEGKLSFYGSHGVVLPDGGVAIAAPGLAFAIYDPQTWKPRRILDPGHEWREPFLVDGGILASRSYESFRFALDDEGPGKKVPERVIVAAGSTVVERKYAHGNPFVQVRVEGAAPLSVRELGYTVVIDRAGTRFADLLGSMVSVLSATDGSTIDVFDLSPRTGLTAKLAFAGDRLIIADDNLVRVADLTTGYISPRGIAPSGGLIQIAVGDDGTVLGIGAEVSTFADGKLVSSIPLGDTTLRNAPGVVRRFGTRTPSYLDKATPTATSRTLDGEQTTWRLERHTDDGWLGSKGDIALVLEWDDLRQEKIVRSDGKRIVDAFSYNSDASIDDIDVDAGLVAISRKGTAHLVDLVTGKRSPHTFRAPRCQEYPLTVIERGGRRISTLDGGDLILWDRDTGKVAASLRHGEDLYEPTFLPGRDEVLVQFRDGFALWSPAARELRVAMVKDLALAALSANGKHLALSLFNGRVALIDFAAARAALPVTTAVAADEPPADCGDHDPLDVSDDREKIADDPEDEIGD